MPSMVTCFPIPGSVRFHSNGRDYSKGPIVKKIDREESKSTSRRLRSLPSRLLSKLKHGKKDKSKAEVVVPYSPIPADDTPPVVESPPAVQKPPISFLALPRELRDRIYMCIALDPDSSATASRLDVNRVNFAPPGRRRREWNINGNNHVVVPHRDTLTRISAEDNGVAYVNVASWRTRRDQQIRALTLARREQELTNPPEEDTRINEVWVNTTEGWDADRMVRRPRSTTNRHNRPAEQVGGAWAERPLRVWRTSRSNSTDSTTRRQNQNANGEPGRDARDHPPFDVRYDSRTGQPFFTRICTKLYRRIRYPSRIQGHALLLVNKQIHDEYFAVLQRYAITHCHCMYPTDPTRGPIGSGTPPVPVLSTGLATAGPKSGTAANVTPAMPAPASAAATVSAATRATSSGPEERSQPTRPSEASIPRLLMPRPFVSGPGYTATVPAVVTRTCCRLPTHGPVWWNEYAIRTYQPAVESMMGHDYRYRYGDAMDRSRGMRLPGSPFGPDVLQSPTTRSPSSSAFSHPLRANILPSAPRTRPSASFPADDVRDGRIGSRNEPASARSQPRAPLPQPVVLYTRPIVPITPEIRLTLRINTRLLRNRHGEWPSFAKSHHFRHAVDFIAHFLNPTLQVIRVWVEVLSATGMDPRQRFLDLQADLMDELVCGTGPRGKIFHSGVNSRLEELYRTGSGSIYDNYNYETGGYYDDEGGNGDDDGDDDDDDYDDTYSENWPDEWEDAEGRDGNGATGTGTGPRRTRTTRTNMRARRRRDRATAGTGIRNGVQYYWRSAMLVYEPGVRSLARGPMFVSGLIEISRRQPREWERSGPEGAAPTEAQ